MQPRGQLCSRGMGRQHPDGSGWVHGAPPWAPAVREVRAGPGPCPRGGTRSGHRPATVAILAMRARDGLSQAVPSCAARGRSRRTRWSGCWASRGRRPSVHVLLQSMPSRRPLVLVAAWVGTQLVSCPGGASTPPGVWVQRRRGRRPEASWPPAAASPQDPPVPRAWSTSGPSAVLYPRPCPPCTAQGLGGDPQEVSVLNLGTSRRTAMPAALRPQGFQPRPFCCEACELRCPAWPWVG